MNTAHTIHLSGKDAIAVEGRSVVVRAQDGSWLTLRPEDAATAHRLEACFGLLREDMAVTKAERLDVLARVEAAA